MRTGATERANVKLKTRDENFTLLPHVRPALNIVLISVLADSSQLLVTAGWAITGHYQVVCYVSARHCLATRCTVSPRWQQVATLGLRGGRPLDTGGECSWRWTIRVVNCAGQQDQRLTCQTPIHALFFRFASSPL